MTSLTSVLGLFLISSILLSSSVKAGPDPNLRKFVLKSYDKVAAPGDGSSTVEVEIPTLFVNSIDIDENDQSFSLHGWLWLQWTDPRLSWTSSDNSGYLHFATNEIWKPDLSVFNSANQPKMFDFFGPSELLVNSTGNVTWVPPISIKSDCALNLRRWPYDTQTCEFLLGSWTYDESIVNVTIPSSSENFIKNEELYLNNTEWTIIDLKARRESKEYACCPGLQYITLHFSVTVQRRSCTYSYTVVLPILMITLVNIIIFLLPSTRGEKIILGGFNLLVVSIFLLFFHSKLPVLVSTPLMVMLYGVNLFFVVIIIALAALVSNFTDDKNVCGSPPKWTHISFNKTIASLLCLKSLQKITNAKRDGRSYSFKSGGNGNVAVEEIMIEQPKPRETDSGNKAEWLYLAAVIDRISLLVYVFLSLTLFVYVHL